MISPTTFCVSPGSGDRARTYWTDALDFAKPVGLGLDHLEYLLAESADELPSVDRADSTDHAGRKVFFDAIDRGQRRGPHETGLELLAVAAIVDPFPGGGDPLTGGDCRRVTDNRHEIPVSARLGSQNAEAVV